jgi:hypothetical protein
MSAPEKIYRHATGSKNLFQEAIYADHPWPEDNPVEYIRADLHEAAMAALKADHQERVFMVRAELKAATLLMDHALHGSAESCVKNAELRTENARLTEEIAATKEGAREEMAGVVYESSYQLAKLKAENARLTALLAPPTIMTAEEIKPAAITQPGFYMVKYHNSTMVVEEIDQDAIEDGDIDPGARYMGPLKWPEVQS